MNKNVTDTLKSAGAGLAVTITVLIVVVTLHPPPPLLIAGFLLFKLTREVYKAFKNGWVVTRGWGTRLLKSAATLTLFLAFLLWLAHTTGGWGLLGLALVILTISAWILWTRRELYLFWIREIERQLYGETMEERRERHGNRLERRKH